MTKDDQSPPPSLPNPVRLQRVHLMWVPFGLEPLSSYRGDHEEHQTLASAVNAACDQYEAHYKLELLPWLRAGTGGGAAVLNLQAILLLKEALREGLEHFQPVK